MQLRALLLPAFAFYGIFRACFDQFRFFELDAVYDFGYFAHCNSEQIIFVNCCSYKFSKSDHIYKVSDIVWQDASLKDVAVVYSDLDPWHAVTVKQLR